MCETTVLDPQGAFTAEWTWKRGGGERVWSKALGEWTDAKLSFCSKLNDDGENV